MINRYRCQICTSRQTRRYKIVGRAQIFRCEKCNVAFIDPKTPRMQTSHIYLFAEYQKREDQFVKRFQKTIALIQKYIKGREVLEVGAGFGLLSKMLSEKGYKVDALEPCVKPVYLKNSSVKHIKKYFETFAKQTKKKYDAIILFDVLEHVDFPKQTVLLLKKLLNKNGVVFIQTPNYQSVMARIVRNWSWWMVEDHRFFFSKKSFSYLFPKNKWRERLFTTYEDWIDFKKNLDGNFGSNRAAKYLFFSWWIPVYFLLRRFLWSAGKGGLIMTIYQKI